MSGPDWSEEEKQRLEALWYTREDGKFLSAPEVGRRMNRSRGMVLGQVRRMKLVRDGAKPKKPKNRPVLMVSTPHEQNDDWFSKQFQPEEPKTSEVEIEPSDLGDLRIRTGEPCCYPRGVPGRKSFRFCGAPTVAGKPYCAACAAIVYVAMPLRKTEARCG